MTALSSEKVIRRRSRAIALTGGQALGILASVRADFAFIAVSGLDAEEGARTPSCSRPR